MRIETNLTITKKLKSGFNISKRECSIRKDDDLLTISDKEKKLMYSVTIEDVMKVLNGEGTS